MLVDDELCYLRRHLLRSFAPPPHLFVIEPLCHSAVFLPPSAERVHIVCTGCTNALIRCVSRMRELNRRIFRHTLYLERQNLQLMHHVRHASRHHTQVFAAAEHMGSTYERRQFAHRRVAPELGMTAIEIIVVDAHQYLFLVRIEFVERMALIDRDTRMQPSRPALVFHEEHLAMEINQSVAYILRRSGTQSAGFELFLVAHQAVVPSLHLRLGIKLRTEPIDIVIACLEGMLFSPFCIISQHVSQEIGADIRLGHSIPVEANTLCA